MKQKISLLIGYSAEEVVKQVDASLERLQTSCVAVLYLHSPGDNSIPIEETLKGVHQCFQGKHASLLM